MDTECQKYNIQIPETPHVICCEQPETENQQNGPLIGPGGICFVFFFPPFDLNVAGGVYGRVEAECARRVEQTGRSGFGGPVVEPPCWLRSVTEA